MHLAVLTAALALTLTLKCTISGFNTEVDMIYTYMSKNSKMCVRYNIRCTSGIPMCSLEDIKTSKVITWYGQQFDNTHTTCAQAQQYFKARIPSAASDFVCCQDKDNCNMMAIWFLFS